MLTSDQLTDSWKRIRPSIIWVALQRVGSLDTAIDIADEAFYRAWKNREKWSPTEKNANPDGWIFRIATNIALDYLKSFRYRTEKLFPVLFEGEQPTIDPIEDADIRMHVAALPSWETLTASCTPEQREALDLYFRGELTYAEIGKRIGKRPGACKSRVDRGIRKVRENRDQGWLEKYRISG